MPVPLAVPAYGAMTVAAGSLYATVNAALSNVDALRKMGRIEEGNALEKRAMEMYKNPDKEGLEQMQQELVASQNVEGNSAMQVPGESMQDWKSRVYGGGQQSAESSLKMLNDLQVAQSIGEAGGAVQQPTQAEVEQANLEAGDYAGNQDRQAGEYANYVYNQNLQAAEARANYNPNAVTNEQGIAFGDWQNQQTLARQAQGAPVVNRPPREAYTVDSPAQFELPNFKY